MDIIDQIKSLNNELIQIFSEYKYIMIYIQGSPDPDALASSYALKYLGSIYDVKMDIVAGADVSLLKNRVFINTIGIPFHIKRKRLKYSKYNGYAVLDFQAAKVKDIGDDLPCLIHIDHHETADENHPSKFRYVTEKVGSVSTIMSFLIEPYSESLGGKIFKKVTTALYYGILSDTDNLVNANITDRAAIGFLERYYDGKIISKLLSTPYSPLTRSFIEIGERNCVRYKDWLISGIGYIPESNRDSIAIIADMLLEKEDVSLAMAYAIVESDKKLYLDTSLRARKASIDLNSLIKSLTRNGGGRKGKGAFQVDLDFFMVIQTGMNSGH
ncbi:MAG TPA: DHH family phosphoesterase [Spirochaetota bacterium]|nr:DHH family phosphoesterase [Spirochaetota bacterium]